MKNIAFKLTSIFLALALLCGMAVIAAQAAYGPGTKLVVLGDSIPAGEGATEKSKEYAEILKTQKGFDVENHAVGGHKSADLLAILDTDEAAKQDIRDADIIALNIGGNDLLASNVITLVLRLIFLGDESAADEYIEAFRPKFAQAVEKIRALNPDALFIVQTLYNCMEGVPLVGSAYEVAVLKLNAIYWDYLEANPDTYVIADVYEAFKGRDGLVFRDRLHPSDDGHAMIARVLTAIIDGTALDLEPLAGCEPGFFGQIVVFFRALVDYLGYWLSIYSPLELLQKAIGFIV